MIRVTDHAGSNLHQSAEGIVEPPVFVARCVEERRVTSMGLRRVRLVSRVGR